MAYSYWDGKSVSMDALAGKTFEKIEEDGECLRFYINDRHWIDMHHYQDCCETVYIEDISGNLEDLVGSPILHAEEAESDVKTGEYGDETMWTFYKLATVKGWVDIRWCGSSNGYYSISVSLTEYNVDEIEAKKNARSR